MHGKDIKPLKWDSMSCNFQQTWGGWPWWLKGNCSRCIGCCYDYGLEQYCQGYRIMDQEGVAY